MASIADLSRETARALGEGRTGDAERLARLALAAEPGEPGLVYNLALALIAGVRWDEARSVLEAALGDWPDHPKLLLGLAFLEKNRGRPGAAAAYLERAVVSAPGDAALLGNLGLALLEAGRSGDAAARFRQALVLDPSSAGTHSNLIFAQDEDPTGDTAGQQRERRRWYERHGRALAPPSGGGALDAPDPERRLRVGYVSADFCRHSAAAIFGPVIRGHDRGRFAIVCYSSTLEPDEETARFRSTAGLWRDVARMPDEGLAAQIREDRVDISVDLSGHSGGNRLLVFARKPAPIQISAWGHATGTGLPTMDVLFADGVTAPDSERRLFSERVETLPCLLTFEPPPDAPPPAKGPLGEGLGPVFGSFNRVAKMTDRVLGRWAEIAAAVPGARLLLKDAGFDDPDIRARVLGALAAAGLAPERTTLLGRTDRLAHLAAFAGVDVALDPFPMNGGLSTLEALWMGVPVVVLRGKSISGRGGASIMTAAGLGDWIAETEADYGTLAVRAAADPARLALLRTSLRDRLAATPLANPKTYVAAVEALYRRLWRERCASGT